jgi:cytochrome c biogenesis protein
MKIFIKRLYGLLTSTRLTLTLLFILTFFMLLGTILPQGGTEEEYTKAFGQKMYLRISPFGVLDIFHAWYFIAAGIILYINLFLCTVRGFIIERRKDAAMRGPFHSGREMKGNVSRVEEGLKKLGFRYKRIRDDNESVFLIGRKGIRKKYVSVFFHFFIGFSIVGFLLSAFTKFDGYIDFEVGDKNTIPLQSEEMGLYTHFLNFDPERVVEIEVGLEKYEMEYVPFRDGYFPKDYKSTLVARYENRVKKKTIEVNSPMRFLNISLFQWGYGQRFDIVVDDTVLNLESGNIFTIPGIEGSFMIRSIYVGKVFTDEGEEEIVPHGKLYYRKGMGKWKVVGELEIEKEIEVFEKTVLLTNVREISGILYKRDDGVPWLYMSFFLFMCGLVLRVFVPSYEFKVSVEKTSEKVFVKGSSSGIGAGVEQKIDAFESLLIGPE